MEPEVEALPDLKQEEGTIINGTQNNDEITSENDVEPSEGTTTADKIGIVDSTSNDIGEEHKDPENSVPLIESQQNDDLNGDKCAEIKQEPNYNGQSDYNKQDNQEAEEDDEEEEEEEVEEKDEEVDKMDDKKPNKDSDNQDGSQCDDKLSFLGRNRRVRQKNRYFLDFHCTDLTKGARSNRDDYDDLTTTTTGTRSSNRRSTTDSTRGQDVEPEVFETRYCRKCLTKTTHDFDGGCQACLYKKIVESSKRQKPSNQRNRSASNKQQTDNNELESTSSSTNNKRKSSKQGGNKSKYLNQKFRNLADVRNCSDSSNDNNVNIVNPPAPLPPPPTSNPPTTIITTTTANTTINANIKNDINGGCNKLPKLDLWTPDEVAEYIISKGFVHEAELFKAQSVDGISLLLMQRTDFTYGLKIKLGPALKIYDQVCKLKKEYFKTVTISQQ